MESLIVYDLDGCLIDSDHHLLQPLMDFLHPQVTIHSPGLTMEDFRELTKPMHHKHGSSITGWQKHLGLDDDWTNSKFLECAPILAEVVIDNITPDELLLQELDAQRSKGADLAVLTQSHEVYAGLTMQKAGLFRVIKRENVFGQSRSKALKTDPSGIAYEEVLKELKAHGKQRFMVENTLANLVMAREKGFKTALTNVPPPADMSLLDFYHPTILQTSHALLLAL